MEPQYSNVGLARKFWKESRTKEELKQRIVNYISKCYPGYKIVKVRKYYAICEMPNSRG